MTERIESFRGRLERALSYRDMRPVDLAKKAGISESTISQYRSGYATPKQPKLLILADALQVDAGWLMGLDLPMLKREKNAGESGNMAERESLFIQEIDSYCAKLNEDSLKRLAAYAAKLYDLQHAEEELK